MTAVSYEPPPAACERLGAIVARFGGEITPSGSRGGRLDYPLPADGSNEVREFLKRRASVTLDAGYLARLPGGRVFGSGNILSPDGRMIARDVSEDFGKPFSDHWLLTYPRIRAPLWVVGKTAVIATTLGAGYSHWLLEELPRLLSAGWGDCDALIANARAPFAQEALKYSGYLGAVLPVKRDRHLQCEQLLVPGLPGPAGYPTSEVVRLVTAFAASLCGGETAVAPSERIYVSRAKARRRRLSNEDALWPHLEARGFRKLFLEEMPWVEQIAAFRAARVVVAPHGAGLANLVFCEAGARVVEIFNRAYVNPCFWRLAALKGLDYRAVVARGDQPLDQALHANREDIEVDGVEVLRMLA